MTADAKARHQIARKLVEAGWAVQGLKQIIHFTDARDPAPRSRELFHFFRPEQLAEWAAQPETQRRRRADQMPTLPGRNLCIVIDGRHRSVCNVWTTVLDYFDSFLTGLTATPDCAHRWLFPREHRR